jgi:hypothetical protein
MKENENNQFNGGQGDFGLPGDYFQKSVGSILNKIEWQEEHKQFSKLLQYKNDHGFSVPANFFAKNEQRLELVDLPNLSSLSKTNPFTVPENYFEESESGLLSAHLVEEENELQGFNALNTLSKQPGFKTEAGYFTKNEATLIALLETKKTAKVLNLFSAKTWYAAAALLVVALGFWTYNQYYTPVEKDCGTLACLDKTELINTKTLERLDNEDLYEIVNTKKLEENLNSDAGIKNETIKNDSSSREDALDDLLDEI